MLAVQLCKLLPKAGHMALAAEWTQQLRQRIAAYDWTAKENALELCSENELACLIVRVNLATTGGVTLADSQLAADLTLGMAHASQHMIVAARRREYFGALAKQVFALAAKATTAEPWASEAMLLMNEADQDCLPDVDAHLMRRALRAHAKECPGDVLEVITVLQQACHKHKSSSVPAVLLSIRASGLQLLVGTGEVSSDSDRQFHAQMKLAIRKMTRLDEFAQALTAYRKCVSAHTNLLSLPQDRLLLCRKTLDMHVSILRLLQPVAPPGAQEVALRRELVITLQLTLQLARPPQPSEAVSLSILQEAAALVDASLLGELKYLGHVAHTM